MKCFDNSKFHKDMDLIPFVFNRRQLHILNVAMFLYLYNYKSFDQKDICGSEMQGYIKDLKLAMNLRYDFNFVLNNEPNDIYNKPFIID